MRKTYLPSEHCPPTLPAVPNNRPNVDIFKVEKGEQTGKEVRETVNPEIENKYGDCVKVVDNGKTVRSWLFILFE